MFELYPCTCENLHTQMFLNIHIRKYTNSNFFFCFLSITHVRHFPIKWRIEMFWGKLNRNRKVRVSSLFFSYFRGLWIIYLMILTSFNSIHTYILYIVCRLYKKNVSITTPIIFAPVITYKELCLFSWCKKDWIKVRLQIQTKSYLSIVIYAWIQWKRTCVRVMVLPINN